MKQFPAVRRWLLERARLEAALVDQPSLAVAVAARCAELRLRSDDRDALYAALLERDPSEGAFARALVAVPETWLFRGVRSFEAVRAALRARSSAAFVRMLSAGCANGAEAMSLAIAAACEGRSAATCAVDAVDVNPVALAAIEHGRYTGLAVREAPPDWARPWLIERDGIVVRSEARAMVQPWCADLLTWTPPCAQPAGGASTAAGYDVIFCRNLFIYLASDARRELLERLVALLEPGGLFVVGHADGVQECAALSNGRLRPVEPVDAFALERVEPGRRSGEAASARTSTTSVAAVRSGARGTRRAEPLLQRPTPAERPQPDSLDAAAAQAARGDAPGAIAMLERLLRRAPEDARLHCVLGETLADAGRLDAAEASLKRAVYLDPKSERALIRLSMLAEAAGRTEAAARWRARALAVHLEEGEGDARG
jgi:chemotaxis methyl-accepting protein methylase/Tfp pilus assembly protein PilF